MVFEDASTCCRSCAAWAANSAVTSIEYALIICLISTAAVGAMTNLGQTLFNLAGPIAMALH